MKAGHDALMNHPFFGSIDWALLEAKEIRPPYIPRNEVLECMRKTNSIPKTLPELLIEAHKSHWCEEFKSLEDGGGNKQNRFQMKISPEDQNYFND